jgi:hypothetical protein
MLKPPANASRADRAWRKVGLAASVAALAAACTPASDPNNPLRGAATAVGFATTAGEPKDFVKARRTGKELAFIPVGRGGIERATPLRNADQARSLEAELDRQRDQSDAFARRTLPAGAYGAPLPSVAAPPRPASAAATPPAGGQPASYPVGADRMRRIRENAQRANTN